MVSVSNLTLQYGERYLFNNVSFNIGEKNRIGLVGRNGAGKSTLLKVIAGEEKADKLDFSRSNEYVIGYLPQEMDFNTGNTVMEEVKTVFKEILDMEDEVNKISEEISIREDYESDDYMEKINKLSELSERITDLGGYSIDADMEVILIGLGFQRSDFDRKTEEFSGGWRMRIELAKILLSKSDLLLLDEPTNHLDIVSIQWLEDFLKKYHGSLILVSHDRAFLDNVTNRTIEIILGKIYDYKANYSKFMVLRKERIEQQLAAFENQQKQIKNTEKFIERFRAKASKATQVQSRVKQLNKLDRIEIDIEDNRKMKFRLPEVKRSGKIVLDIERVEKKYGENIIFTNTELTIERGEKVAFVGRNGEGKTTMSKLIVGEEDYTGKIDIGHNVDFGYYAQNQSEKLDSDKTVLATIEEDENLNEKDNPRSLLGSFLFTGDDVKKKVKVLSGGERARLAMCKMLLRPVNFLILDEPTNHLDINSKEILREALERYTGTILIVSHDRDFLNGLTNKIFEFENKKVTPFVGSIYQFLESKKVETFNEFELQKKQNKKAAKKKDKPKEELSDEQRKKNSNRIKKLKSLIKKIEVDIENIEKENANINQELEKPENFSNQALFSSYGQNNKQIENKMSEWESFSSELEKLHEIMKQ